MGGASRDCGAARRSPARCRRCARDATYLVTGWARRARAQGRRVAGPPRRAASRPARPPGYRGRQRGGDGPAPGRRARGRGARRHGARRRRRRGGRARCWPRCFAEVARVDAAAARHRARRRRARRHPRAGAGSRARCARSWRPKVLGTWLLDRATREMELDFFVLFSSTTALLGATGFAPYAAANQFLDAVAHARRARRRAGGERELGHLGRDARGLRGGPPPVRRDRAAPDGLRGGPRSARRRPRRRRRPAGRRGHRLDRSQAALRGAPSPALPRGRGIAGGRRRADAAGGDLRRRLERRRTRCAPRSRAAVGPRGDRGGAAPAAGGGGRRARAVRHGAGLAHGAGSSQPPRGRRRAQPAVHPGLQLSDGGGAGRVPRHRRRDARGPGATGAGRSRARPTADTDDLSEDELAALLARKLERRR